MRTARRSRGALVRAVEGAEPAGETLEVARRVHGNLFMSLGAKVMAHTRTGDNGSYRLEGVPAALVSIVARAEGCFASYTQPLRVPVAAEIAAPDLVLEPLDEAHTVRGVVFDEDGTVLSGTRVYAYENRGPRNMTPYRSTTDDTGRFELALVPGRAWSLEVHHPSNWDREVILHDVVTGTQELSIRFPSPRFVSIRVRATRKASWPRAPS